MGNKRNGGLGRGLAALIPTDDRPSTPHLGDAAADIILGSGSQKKNGKKSSNKSRTAAATAAKKAKNRPVGAVYRDIPIDSIRPNEKQPRTVFDEDLSLIHI